MRKILKNIMDLNSQTKKLIRSATLKIILI